MPTSAVPALQPANPHDLGTLALIVELALIVVVVAHAASLQARRAVSGVPA